MTHNPVGPPPALDPREPVIEADELVERLLRDPDPHSHLAHAADWPEPFAARVVERLKQEADRQWYSDPNVSLKLAEGIMAIGRQRRDLSQAALGMMARGDALKFVGQMEEAWETLEQAGDMFQWAGDDVGWARTRIGRLYAGMKLNRVAEALSDTERARQIFIENNQPEKLLRLYLQTAYVHNYLGENRQALEVFDTALEIAKAIGEAGHQYLATLHLNIGSAYSWLGDFHEAMASYQQALAWARANNEALNVSIIQTNIALIHKSLGQYRQALLLLHEAGEQASALSGYTASVIQQDLIDCYASLNRYAEARDLAQQAIHHLRQYHDSYELARTLLHLATAEAALGHIAGAQSALEEAGPIFSALGSGLGMAITQLWRGRMELHVGEAEAAYHAASQAVRYFAASGHDVHAALAALLQGQAMLALGRYEGVADAGAKALATAQHFNVSSLRYTAHLLLGRVAEAQRQVTRAKRHYFAATATLERVQRHLTITLRPGFLEDKEEAARALIGMYLRANEAENAFAMVERVKAHVLLGYLANRDGLHWARNDTQSHELIEELQRLRAEHQWFYRLAHEPRWKAEQTSAVTPEQARAEVADRERRMRMITEQLYLRNGDVRLNAPAATASVHDVQNTLDAETALIEFYNDGARLWAFVVEARAITVCPLPDAVAQVNQWLAQLHLNLGAALQTGENDANLRNLCRLAQRILQRLYTALLAPLELTRRAWRRLIVGPYGPLHYLPFHLLHDGAHYLIEQYEVVTLPAASLMLRPRVRRQPGALALAHSWDGRLPNAHVEAQLVHRLFGGRVCVEAEVKRSALEHTPVQILHIAAHGQHRLDQPDLSYLHLADGQLYADDLFQLDLSYELVTLSACETGRANVTANDELIGLGRGFLYAGADALILSLWPVVDHVALQLMGHFYDTLKAGASKASALREAQRAVLAENPQLHPAYWGAFQLIGNPQPLSQFTR